MEPPAPNVGVVVSTAPKVVVVNPPRRQTPDVTTATPDHHLFGDAAAAAARDFATPLHLATQDDDENDEYESSGCCCCGGECGGGHDQCQKCKSTLLAPATAGNVKKKNKNDMEEFQALLSSLQQENVNLRSEFEAFKKEVASHIQEARVASPLLSPSPSPYPVESAQQSEEAHISVAAAAEAEAGEVVGRRSLLAEQFSSKMILVDTKQETLPQDSFSFLVVSPIGTTPFFSAMAVFGIQMSTFLLLPLNIAARRDDNDHSTNSLGIPANVSAAVRGTQIIALVITVLTQDDIRTGLNQIHQGYYHAETITRAFEHTTTWKFAFSVWARCTEGLLSLIVTFYLIATADNSLDLLLNFTAMGFVSQLDEIFFLLAQQGFAGRNNKALAERIADTPLDVISKGRRHLSPFLLLLITMIAMMIGWTMLMLKQTSGAFLCDTIFVQFGDDFVPALGTFSGLYDRQKGRTGVFSADRVKYINRRTNKASFSYCHDIASWVFAYENVSPQDNQSHATNDNGGSCHWIARSPITDTFDLTQLADATWIVRNSQLLHVELDRFYMSCYDCDDGMDLMQSCGGRGTCSNAVCNCNNDWFGLRCEFRQPCTSLRMDERYNGFLADSQWPDTFHLLQQEYNATAVKVYDRPVFFNEFQSGVFGLIYYTGRRWVATSSQVFPKSLLSANGTIQKDVLIRYFVNDFHGYYSNIPVVFISTPADVKTPLDGAVPVGVQWFHALAANVTDTMTGQGPDVSGGGLEASLLCSVCSSNGNPCFYDGQCHENGFCQCAIGASGTLCQIPPVGNGHCDEFYNTPIFQYDGGDCCESTCTSSDTFICGKDKDAFIDIGYPLCHLPVQQWILNDQVLQGEEYTRFGASVALSGNGKILAVGEPDAARVRLLDKVGSEWQVRGRLLQGPPGSGFGSRVVLSDGLPDATGNRLALPLIYLAVAAQKLAVVRVYECRTDGCSRMGENDINGTLVDISHDGQKVVVVAGRGVVKFYELWNWTRWNVLDSVTNLSTITALSLSGDGNTIAIRHLQNETLHVGQTGTTGQGTGNDSTSVYFWDGKFLRPKGDKLVVSWEWSENLDVPDHSQLMHREYFAQSLDLSYDGNVLAFGMATTVSTRGVHVYTHDNATAAGWSSLGSFLPSNTSEFTEMGRSVSLSLDGSIVVVGVGVHSGQEMEWTGLGTFYWNGTHWEQLGLIEQAGAGISVALAADGSALAVGLPLDRPRMAGSCFLYQYLPAKCPVHTTSLRLSLTLDGAASETTWDIVSSSNSRTITPIFQGGPYQRFHGRGDYNFLTVVFEDCLPKDLCHIFTIYDRMDNKLFASRNMTPNGMDPPASYNLFWNGKLSARGELHGSAARVYFGESSSSSCKLVCPTGSHLVRILTRTCWKYNWTLQDVSTGMTVLQDENREGCDVITESNFWKEACVAMQDCYVLSMFVPLDNHNNHNNNTRRLDDDRLVNAVVRVYVNDTQIDKDQVMYEAGNFLFQICTTGNE